MGCLPRRCPTSIRKASLASHGAAIRWPPPILARGRCSVLQRELAAYVYTDRPIYRPGHTVHMKGVLRWRNQDALAPFDRADAEIVAADPNDKVIFRRQVKVDAFGAVHASFAVPATAALGHYVLRVQSGDAMAAAAFEVQEYRKPEFEVGLTPAKRFEIQGREVVVSVQARYYFGQPVANARVRWVVNQQPYYSPFRWNEGFDGEEGGGYWYGDNQTARGELRLDASGKGELRVPLGVDDNGRDFSARIEAQVTDAANREVSGRTIVHATYGAFMLSAQTSNYVYQPGSQAQIAIRALDYEGAAHPQVPIAAVLERLEYRSGYYSEPTATQVGSANASTDSNGGATVTFTLPNQAGSYRVRISASSIERRIGADVWFWVPGSAETATNEDRYVELIADRRSYQPGEVAHLMVRGETLTGAVLVTKEGQHVSWYRVLRPSATDTLDVPIEDGDVGDMFVSVAYLRDGRLFRAERRIAVPATSRALQVSVTADQAISKPREPGAFTVQVADAAGRPVRAQISLAVIDEAVYGVKPDETPDPIRFFYRREYTRVATTFSREYYFAGYSGRERLQLAGRRRRPFTLADFKGDQAIQAQVRKEFPDAIFWVGDLVTGEDGLGRINIAYPDALTTWRLTARAITTDTRAGTTIARTTTTKDLIVRVVTPRFLTEGDEVVIPTMVHNYRSDPRNASLSIKAAGLETLEAATAPTSGSIAAGGERRDDWRFTAKAPGTATITASATTESDADAVELPLPILPYGIRREVGSSGSIVGAGEAMASVVVPESSNPLSRSVMVSLAPSVAGSMLGALDFLTDYPYGCTEQTVSSFLPNLLVTRALTELKLAPTERLSQLDRMVSAGILRLYDFQNDDGGWGWWKSGATEPFMTAYALWGLEESRRAGVKVEPFRIANGARALARLFTQYPRTIPDLKVYEAFVLQHVRGSEPEIVSYGEGGEHRYRHAAARDELWTARDGMTPYGRALLLMLMDEARDPRGNELAQSLMGEAQTRGDLSWWTVPSDPLLLDAAETSVEATAFAIQALARRDAKNPIVERAARWMMLNRTAGYWTSTKQTAMALYGLLAFMQARGESAQPFSVEVFVNGNSAGRRSFSAADITAADPVVLTVPAQAGANEVRLVKRDGGSVYWSAAAAYHDIAGATARGGDRQLALTRKYSTLSPVTVNGRIVYREQPFTGSASVGDVLVVRLTAAGSPEWRYLALEDPLPAGVEAIQDTTAYPLEREMRNAWWYGSRVEYRDNRTVFFQDVFSAGRYEYSYLVKVIAPGTFRAVPAQISPMYVPSVHASSEPQSFTIGGGTR